MLVINVYTMNDLGDKAAHNPLVTSFMDGVSVRLYDDSGALKEMADKITTICTHRESKRIIKKLRLFLHGVNSGGAILFGEEGDGGDNVIVGSWTNNRTGVSQLTSTSGDLKPLESLKQFMDPKSTIIEVHACDAGKGKVGSQFIQALSNFLEVRVVAPETPQTHASTKFEGKHLLKAKPGGKSPIRVANPDA